MNKIVGLLLVTATILTTAVTDLSAQKRLMGNPIRKDSLTVIEEREDRADQRAVFAVFLAWENYDGLRPEINTALSIANTLAGPPSVQEVFDSEFADLEGTLEFYIWDYLGHLISYETTLGSPGVGLSEEGTLGPGQTYRVLWSELLQEAGYEQHAIDFDHAPNSFAGYAWIVANFDGVQGTVNLTDFTSFTQATTLQPDLGTTFWDFDANAGVPLVKPTEDTQESEAKKPSLESAN